MLDAWVDHDARWSGSDARWQPGVATALDAATCSLSVFPATASVVVAGVVGEAMGGVIVQAATAGTDASAEVDSSGFNVAVLPAATSVEVVSAVGSAAVSLATSETMVGIGAQSDAATASLAALPPAGVSTQMSATYTPVVASDDGYWSPNGLGTTTLIDIGYTKYTGFFRFAVAPPGGVSFSAAVLRLPQHSTLNGTVRLRIRLVDADSPAAPTTLAFAQEMPLSSAYVDWVIADNPSDGWWASPDLSDLFTAQTARSGWASGNAVIVVLSDNGSDSVSSGITTEGKEYGGGTARLSLTWITGGATVAVPAASLAASAPAATAVAGATTAAGAAQISMAPGAASTMPAVESASGLAVLEALAASSAMSTVKVIASTETAKSTISASSASVLTTFEGVYFPVDTADTGQWVPSTGEFYPGSRSTLLLGNWTTVDTANNAWIRFADVAIPTGSQLISAIIRLRASDSNSGTICKVAVSLDADTTPSVPNSIADITGRTKTVATNWTVPGFTAGTDYDVDITDSITEVLGAESWVSGNPILAFLVENGGDANTKRWFYGYGYSSGLYKPELHVSWREATDVAVDTATISATPLPTMATVAAIAQAEMAPVALTLQNALPYVAVDATPVATSLSVASQAASASVETVASAGMASLAWTAPLAGVSTSDETVAPVDTALATWTALSATTSVMPSTAIRLRCPITTAVRLACPLAREIRLLTPLR